MTALLKRLTGRVGLDYGASNAQPLAQIRKSDSNNPKNAVQNLIISHVDGDLKAAAGGDDSLRLGAQNKQHVPMIVIHLELCILNRALHATDPLLKTLFN